MTLNKLALWIPFITCIAFIFITLAYFILGHKMIAPKPESSLMPRSYKSIVAVAAIIGIVTFIAVISIEYTASIFGIQSSDYILFLDPTDKGFSYRYLTWLYPKVTGVRIWIGNSYLLSIAKLLIAAAAILLEVDIAGNMVMFGRKPKLKLIVILAGLVLYTPLVNLGYLSIYGGMAGHAYISNLAYSFCPLY